MMFRFTQLSILLLLSLFVLVSPVLAAHPESKGDLENLKKRIAALEQHGPETGSGQISDYIDLQGVIEVEAGYNDPDGGDAESDLVLAAAELSLEASISDYIGGHIILLYEEGEDFTVDEAVISLTCAQQVAGASSSLHAGQMYLPFGMFNSYMVSDPLTLELGETGDTALLFELAGELWNIKLGVFNGDADVAGDKNHIDDFVAALEVAPNQILSFGASYISDLAESDSGLISELDIDSGFYTDDIAGFSGFVSLHVGPLGLEAEYLGALDTFDTASLVATLTTDPTDLTGDEPEAWNVELAWMPSEILQLAVRYEEATDFQSDLQRYGATITYGIFDNVVVALEYLNAEEDIPAGGESDMVTAQLALEF